MIRTSKHNITNITNDSKLSALKQLFMDYKQSLEEYITLIINNQLPLKKLLTSKELPNTKTITHSRYKQLIYKQASEIIRSQIDKSNKKRYNTYKKVYTYFKKTGRMTKFTSLKWSELNLKPLLESKYFTKPSLKNLTITFDERFFNIKDGNYFDNFVKITLPYFNEKGTRALSVNLPINQHFHSNKMRSSGYKLKQCIQLKEKDNSFYINLIWEKEVPKVKQGGKTLAFDMGYKKLLSDSNGKFYGKEFESLCTKISNKKQGSNNFKKSLKERDCFINKTINDIDLSDVDQIIIEDLKDVKKGSKPFRKSFRNKYQRWVYPNVIDKFERICDEHGILLVKVSPSYTSQKCSKCDNIDKKSRNGEHYHCLSCGYEIDADYNAAINILNRGVYGLSDVENRLIGELFDRISQ